MCFSYFCVLRILLIKEALTIQFQPGEGSAGKRPCVFYQFVRSFVGPEHVTVLIEYKLATFLNTTAYYIPIQGTLLKYRLLRTYLSVHCWEWWNSLHNSVYNRMLVPWMFRLSRYLLDLIHTIPPHNQWTIRGWITSSHLWSMIVLNIYTKLRQHMFLIPLTRIDNTLNLDYLFLDCSLFCVSAGYFVFHGWDWEIW